jgi:HEPN domain-containing protein
MKSHEAWMFKALHDLKSAQKLIEGDDPILDTAIYHTQQCAEKALKAYLAYCNQPIIKTHDLVALNDKCVIINNEFDFLYDLIEQINQQDTIFRYPTDAFALRF